MNLVAETMSLGYVDIVTGARFCSLLFFSNADVNSRDSMNQSKLRRQIAYQAARMMY